MTFKTYKGHVNKVNGQDAPDVDRGVQVPDLHMKTANHGKYQSSA